MKNIWKMLSLFLVTLAATAVLLQLTGGEALAEESAENWRQKYDVVMLWVNFSLLSFVLVKFGKDPIIRFLRMRRDEVAAQISDLEDEKALVTDKINEARQAMADSDARFAELKAAILRMGEKRRQDLIEEAENESRFMMELAQQKVGGYIQAAKRAFKEELIDASVNLALKRLPDQITDEDNQQLVEHYLDTVDRKISA